MAGLRAGGITVSLILSGLAHAYVLGSMHWSPLTAVEGEPRTLSLRLQAPASIGSAEVVTRQQAGTPPAPVPAVADRVRMIERQPVATPPVRRPEPARNAVRAETRPLPRVASKPQAASPVPTARPPSPRQPASAPALASAAPQPPADELQSPALQLAAAAPASSVSGGSNQDSGAEAELLRLLNEEIARSREYPRIARRQGREGTARVAFTLGPDGRISALEIVDSTRFLALDQAALGAVSAIAPFKPASRYLQESRNFRVEVQFALK